MTESLKKLDILEKSRFYEARKEIKKLNIKIPPIPKETLERITRTTDARECVNYLKHKCTPYDSLLEKYRENKLKTLIKLKCYSAIIKSFPWLYDECKRQISYKVKGAGFGSMLINIENKGRHSALRSNGIKIFSDCRRQVQSVYNKSGGTRFSGILNPKRDEHAIPALRKYAELLRPYYPKIAHEIDEELKKYER